MSKNSNHSKGKFRKIPLFLGGFFIILTLFLICLLFFPNFSLFGEAGPLENSSTDISDPGAFRMDPPERSIRSVYAPMPESYETSSPMTLTEDMLISQESSFASILVKNKLISGAYYCEDENGNVLYSLNEHERMYPASMTKLMTAILAIENTVDLDAVFTVGNLEGSYDEDSMLLELQEGDQLTMRDALYGLLMLSYNDCATAIAIQLGGSLEGFSAMMNQRAEEFGCMDTYFTSPNGLHRDDHYSSAYDMTMILKCALSYDTLQNMMLTDRYTAVIYTPKGEYSKEFEASNYFIRGVYTIPYMQYEGGKTGFTYAARSNLASCFLKDGVRYYSTVMDSTDASFMTMLLLDQQFKPLRCYDDFLITPEMEEYVLSTTENQ